MITFNPFNQRERNFAPAKGCIRISMEASAKVCIPGYTHSSAMERDFTFLHRMQYRTTSAMYYNGFLRWIGGMGEVGGNCCLRLRRVHNTATCSSLLLRQTHHHHLLLHNHLHHLLALDEVLSQYDRPVNNNTATCPSRKDPLFRGVAGNIIIMTRDK